MHTSERIVMAWQVDGKREEGLLITFQCPPTPPKLSSHRLGRWYLLDILYCFLSLIHKIKSIIIIY